MHIGWRRGPDSLGTKHDANPKIGQGRLICPRALKESFVKKFLSPPSTHLPCVLQVMACPATHSKNASQRPGQVILDTVQKRRTSEQKQTDDAQAEQVRQEQAAVREQGIKRIADIIDRNKQVEGDILTNPPRPRPRLVLKPPHVQLSELTTSEPQDPKEDTEMDEEEGGEVVDVEQGDVFEDKPEEEPEGENESDHGELTQKKRRKWTQKTVTREAVQTARGTQESDWGNLEERAEKGNPSVSVVFPSPSAMLLLTETILFYWDSIDYYYRQDSQAARARLQE